MTLAQTKTAPLLKPLARAVLGILSAMCISSNAAAQNATEVVADRISETTNERDYGFTTGSIVVAPIPFKNSLIGAGLALGAGYLFQLDANSDTSVIGLGGLRSENGSNAVALSASLYFHENRWKVGLTSGEAEMFYDLYIGGLPFAIRQDGTLTKTELLYGLTQDIRVGANLRHLDTTIGYDGGTGSLPPLPDVNVELASLSFVAEWDTRDDTFSARDGFLLDFEAMHGEILNGSERSYQKAVLSYSGYHPIGDAHSFAFKVTGCSVASAAPFFDKCSLGGTDSFRGFNPTQYLDNAMLSAQAEYRHQFASRFSAVLFGGAGMTGSQFGALSDDGAHAAGGLGFRFQLSKKFKAMFAVDVAVNDEKDQSVYIYVGQRF